MRWFLRFLFFAAIYSVFANTTVFADNRVSKSSTSPVETVTGQHIDRRSTANPLKIPDNFPLGITSSIWLDDFALFFRTGSWAADAGTLKALAEDGFVADSSANNWARIEESRHEGNGMLYTWNRRHWAPINDVSQPYYPNAQNSAIAGKPTIPILEIPDNGSLVDYVTGNEMIEIFNVN